MDKESEPKKEEKGDVIEVIEPLKPEDFKSPAKEHPGLSKPEPKPPKPRWPLLSEEERMAYAKKMLKHRRAVNEFNKAKGEYDRYLLTLAIEADYTGPPNIAIHDLHIVPVELDQKWRQSNNGVDEELLNEYPKISGEEEKEINRKLLQITMQATKMQEVLVDLNTYLFDLAESLHYWGNFPVEIDDEGYMKPSRAPQQQPQLPQLVRQ